MNDRASYAMFVIAALAGLSLLALVVSAAPSDDAYLREIQAEGNKLETLNKAREEIRQSEAQEKNARGKPGVTVADMKGFEYLLNADAPASYSLYLRLRPEQKSVVIESYRKQGKLSDAKRKVIDLYLGL